MIFDFNSVFPENTQIIHKKSSISWIKISNGNLPYLTDLIIDIAYVKKNLDKHVKFILYILSSMVFFIIFQVFLIYYISVFVIGGVFFILKIVICVLLKKDCIFDGGRLARVDNTNIGILKTYLWLPFRYLFIIVYTLIGCKSGKYEINSNILLSSLTTGIPFWYFCICINWGITYCDRLSSDEFKSKSIKGKARLIVYILWEKLINIYDINIIMKTNGFLYNRRIIIEEGRIRLNGGIVKYAFNKISQNEILFGEPIVVRVGGKIHQAWRRDPHSNVVIIQTSSGGFECEGGFYKTMRFNTKDGTNTAQYFTLSFISDDCVIGTGLLGNIAYKNFIYSDGCLPGLLVKFNVMYNFYQNKQMLFQNKEGRLLFNLSKPIEPAVSHKIEFKGDFDSIIEKCIELDKSIDNVSVKKNDAIVEAIISRSEFEIFCSLKNEMDFENYREKSTTLLIKNNFKFKEDSIV